MPPNMGQIGVGQANAGMNQLYQVGKDQGDAIVLQGKNALNWLGGLMGGGGSALDSPASTGVQPSSPSSFDASQYKKQS